MATRKMVNRMRNLLIFFIILKCQILLYSDSNYDIKEQEPNTELTQTDSDESRLTVVENTLANLQMNLEMLYTKSVSLLNYILSAVLGIISILGVLGFLNIRSIKKAYKRELIELKEFKDEYRNKILEFDPTLDDLREKYSRLKKYIEDSLINDILDLQISEEGDIINGGDVDLKTIKNGLSIVDSKDELPEIVQFVKAKAFYETLEYDKAVIEFKKLINHYKHVPKYPYCLGLTYLEMGNNKDAIVEFDHAIKINSNFYPAHINKANLLLLKDEFKEALQEFSEAARIEPDKINSWLGIASVMLETENFSAAEKALEQAGKIVEKFDIDSDNFSEETLSYKYNKACLFALLKNTSEAIKLLSEIFIVSPLRKHQALIDKNLKSLRENPKFIEITA